MFFSKSGGKQVIFNSFHQFLNALEGNIDFVKLEKQLYQLNKQQNIPKFPADAFHLFVQE